MTATLGSIINGKYATKHIITTKQWQILTVVCDANGKDENGNLIPVDMDELLSRLAYRTSKESMHFSLRPLLKKGYITKDYEKRRGARRMVLVPTRLAMQVMGYGDSPAYIEDLDLSHLDV